jgi:apolipoprotein N-acyltransferase
MLKFLAALIAGCLLPLAFAPINIYSLAFFMPAVLLFVWLRSTPGKAFWLGLVFGIGMFTVGSSWIYISVHNFGNASGFLAGSMTALFILVMSLYPAVQGYLLRKIWQNRSDTLVCLCAFPATWVLFEYIRSFLFDGFPFLFLGYSQINNGLAGFGPIFGVYGLSLIVTLIAGALVLLTRKVEPSRKITGVAVILVLIGVGFGYHNHYWTKPNSKPISISLVQGNISQKMKWDPQELNDIIANYQRLTEAHWSSDIIVWPEAAIPFFPNELPTFFTDLAQEAKLHNATVVVGAPLVDRKTGKYYNGLMLLGNSKGSYRKRHLVPFGEFIPLQSVFGSIMKKLDVPMADLSPGPKQQPTLDIDGIPIAFFICYETAFPVETLEEMKNKQLGINIVDDAWFGHSFAAAQQLQMTQMRALETGRYIAVTANTGITALINPLGKIVNIIPIDTTKVLTVKAVAMTGHTPLMRSNYYPVAVIIILLLLLSMLHKNRDLPSTKPQKDSESN